MKILCFTLWMGIALCICPAYAAIIPLTNLDAIKEKLPQLDEKTLLVFDVDDTLIIQDDALFRPCGRSFLKKQLARLGALPPEMHDELFSIVLLQSTWSVIDPSSPLLIQEAECRGIPTITLTALNPGKVGQIDSLIDWRVSQLCTLGFDFRSAFPTTPCLTLGQPETSPFKAGVLCSGKKPKGEVLCAFLETIHWTPCHVIFVDDIKENLESVEASLQEKGIPSTCYHYTAAQALPCTFDEDVATLQVHHLLKERQWLNDGQAKALLEQRVQEHAPAAS